MYFAKTAAVRWGLAGVLALSFSVGGLLNWLQTEYKEILLDDAKSLGVRLVPQWRGGQRQIVEFESRHRFRQRIRTLAPLRFFPELQAVKIKAAMITDLTPLSSLSDLERLSINSCLRVEDFAPLSNNTSLVHLSLVNTKFRELSLVKNMTGLRSLNLLETNVESLDVLDNLKNLERLSVESRQSNLSPIVDLQQLQLLRVAAPSDAPLEQLTSLTKLRWAEVWGTDGNLAALRNLKHLSHLKVFCERINGIASLANMAGMESLRLRGVMDPNDLRYLEGLNSIRQIRVESPVAVPPDIISQIQSRYPNCQISVKKISP